MYDPFYPLCLLKHVPAVHARGNQWGGFLLSVLKLVFLSTKVSVLKFPCARWHSCYSKRVCMHCHAGDPYIVMHTKYKDNPCACTGPLVAHSDYYLLVPPSGHYHKLPIGRGHDNLLRRKPPEMPEEFRMGDIPH